MSRGLSVLESVYDVYGLGRKSEAARHAAHGCVIDFHSCLDFKIMVPRHWYGKGGVQVHAQFFHGSVLEDAAWICSGTVSRCFSRFIAAFWSVAWRGFVAGLTELSVKYAMHSIIVQQHMDFEAENPNGFNIFFYGRLLMIVLALLGPGYSARYRGSRD